MMRKFFDSTTFRRHEHDRISTALAGGHDDDTSCCSLSVDCRTPNFQVREGGDPSMKRLYMYYGNDVQYEVKKVSDIRANDYVFAHRSNSSQDPVDMISIYEACSRALDDGMFVFQPGAFDCGNKYLEAKDLYDPDKPWIKPDRLFPYYFRSTSPISGRITWDEMNSSDFGLRHVFVINTDLDDDLAAKIPDGTIIYVGGDHSRDQLGFSSQYQPGSVDWDLLLKMECKMKISLRERFSSCSCQRNVSQTGQVDYRMFRDQSSSSLSDCCSAWSRAIENTTSCIKYEGYKTCGQATAEVRSVHGFSQVPLIETILSLFKVEAVFNTSDSGGLVKNTIIDGREMKGYCLEADELKSKLLPSVFKVLGGEIVRLHRDDIDIHSGLMSWLMKLLRSSELMNTPSASPNNIYCSEEYDVYGCELIVVAKMKLAAVSSSPADSAGLSPAVFKIFTTFVARKSSGTFQVGGKAPGGDGMFMVIFDTKKGLLSGCIAVYHTVHTGNGTSYDDAVSTDMFVFWNSNL